MCDSLSLITSFCLSSKKAIGYYLVYIIEQSGITSRVTQMVILLGLGVFQLLVILLVSHLFDREGRRTLLLLSLFGCAASFVTVAISFTGVAEASGAITIAGMALFLAFFSIGVGPGGWLVASEVFSTLIRGKAMSVA